MSIIKMQVGDIPDVTHLKRLLNELPQDLRFDKEAREKILQEDKEVRRKEKDKHPMADFRIEIMFGSTRSSQKATSAKIRVWESAKRLTGDGDVSMHFCANSNCIKPFSAEYFTGDFVTCPHCHKTCLRENTVTALGPFRRDMWEVRSVVAQLFYTLRGNADIVCVWFKRDIRLLENAQHMDQFHEFEVKDYERVVYPYWRILQDTMHNQSLDVQLRGLLG